MTRPQSRTVCALLLSVLLLSACRLEYETPAGGEVRTLDIFGDYLLCDAGEDCTVNVTYAGYYQPIEAVAHAGWRFAGWRQDGGYLCGPGRGSLEYSPAICVLDNGMFYGNAAAEAAIASNDVALYVSPVFVAETVGIPLTDTIVVAGREWAQPVLFEGLSWDGINATCPGGSCGPGAILRGYDMNGWTWATVDDVNALANHYLAGEYTMGPGPDVYNDAWAALGSILPGAVPGTGGPWRLTRPPGGLCAGCVAHSLLGLTATEYAADSSRAHVGYFYRSGSAASGSGTARISTTGVVAKDNNYLRQGAFFYRLP